MPRRNIPKRSIKTSYTALRTPDVASTLYVACRNKRRFPTEKQAVHGAETQELLQPALELKVYHCTYCSGWHLSRARK